MSFNAKMNSLGIKNNFDFLRFFFAFNILLAHLCELSESMQLSFLNKITNSKISIMGFFVVSGFLVSKSYLNSISLRAYFIKRVKRILPAYLFVVCFSVIFLSIFSELSFLDYFSSLGVWLYIFWNGLFLNFAHPCLPGLFGDNLMCAVNGSLWTLKVEEGFYILLPLIMLFIKKTQKKYLTLVFLYFFSILYWYVLSVHFDSPRLAKQLPGYLSFFSVGIFLFFKFEDLMRNRELWFLLSLIVIIVSSCFSKELNFLYPLAFGTFVITVAYGFSMFNDFGKYGDFTYGVYIFHFPIIQVFRQFNLFERYNAYLMALFVILITFVFSIFSWFVIEKRFLDRYKKIVIK